MYIKSSETKPITSENFNRSLLIYKTSQGTLMYSLTLQKQKTLKLENKMMVLKVCGVTVLVFFLVGVTTAAMDCLNHLGTNHHDSDSSDEPSESSEPCCDSCICSKSIPPQCHHTDIRLNSCHSACKSCMCTRSMPGKLGAGYFCRCLDIADVFCYKPCKSRDEDDDE
uniref:Trypsin inhibitor n=1 Tax=Vigna unguiculata TaxID=3917 RepID=Q8GT33_VIGUN|nr:trypsin inhibitor [Vigna unguiculata]